MPSTRTHTSTHTPIHTHIHAHTLTHTHTHTGVGGEQDDVRVAPDGCGACKTAGMYAVCMRYVCGMYIWSVWCSCMWLRATFTWVCVHGQYLHAWYMVYACKVYVCTYVWLCMCVYMYICTCVCMGCIYSTYTQNVYTESCSCRYGMYIQV